MKTTSYMVNARIRFLKRTDFKWYKVMLDIGKANLSLFKYKCAIILSLTKLLSNLKKKRLLSNISVIGDFGL